MVFVNSMSDLFHRDVPEKFISSVFETMAEASHHHFQILTKRPKRMARVVPGLVDRFGLLPNVWLGTSIENDDYTWRADYVRRAPAAVRFLSVEPLLGPVPSLDLAGINWIIVGGESGPRARALAPEWVRVIRDRATTAGVSFFFKQWGGRTPKAGGRILDGRTWDELPPRRPSRSAVPIAL